MNLRETRRWRADDVAATGIPRSRPAVAAIRGALWARSDRQAALLLTMTVQQGLCRAEDLATEMLRIRRDKRRTFLHEIILDLAGGVRSLGELDVVRGCRERGLPAPDLQVNSCSTTSAAPTRSSRVVRRTGSRRFYLDLRWERWGLVVELDGVQHSWATALVPDALRHNTIALTDDVVLRLPVLGLRVCPDEFFAQIAEGLARRGWIRAKAG